MQLIVHVKGFYEWVDLPNDVDKESDDFKRGVKAGKVKQLMNGGWSMQVPKEMDTNVDIGIGEEDLIQVIIQEMTRGDRRHLTRMEAATRYVARHSLPIQSHASNVQEIEFASDAGPDEELFRKMMQEHIDCHNIDPLDFDGLLESYMTPATSDDQVDHLHTHFNVKSEDLQTFRAARVEKEETLMAARAHYASQLAKKDEVES
jgi:hypothetical protein